MAGNIRYCCMNTHKYIWPFYPCLFCLPHSLHMSGVSVEAWFVARPADRSTKTVLAFLQAAWSHNISKQRAEQTMRDYHQNSPLYQNPSLWSVVSHDEHLAVRWPWANVEEVQWSVHSRYRVLLIHAKCSFDMHGLSPRKCHSGQSVRFVPAWMGKMKAHGAKIRL